MLAKLKRTYGLQVHSGGYAMGRDPATDWMDSAAIVPRRFLYSLVKLLYFHGKDS